MYTRTVTPQNAVALTVSGGATPSNTSGSIDCVGAIQLTLQVRNTLSTVLTASVYGSPDNSVFDDQAYASVVLAADQEKTIAIAPGPNYVKVTVVNGDAANATVVTTKLSIGRQP